MSGDKKGPFGGNDEIDWDAALSEWDKKPFEPDLAAGKDAKKEPPKAEPPKAEPPRPKPAARPLYAPPKDLKKAAAAPEPVRAEVPTATNEVEVPPAPPSIDPKSLSDLVDEDDDSTRVGESPLSERKGGGLGALFRKEEGVDVALDDLDAPPRKKLESDPSVVTSARDVETNANPYAEPMRRPSLLDRSELVADGEMFDPFREVQDERTEVPTVHPRGASAPDLSAQKIPKAPALPVTPAAGTPAAPPSPATAEPVGIVIDESEPILAPAADADSTGEYGEVGVDELLGDAPTGERAAQAPAAEEAPRKFDPDAETGTHDRHELGVDELVAAGAAVAPAVDVLGETVTAEVASQIDDAGEHAEAHAPRVSTPPLASAPPPAGGEWEDEKPAAHWLSDEVRQSVLSRAEWLEAEARQSGDKAARARGLLVVSELVAMGGEPERAAALAQEARDLLPSSAIAQRQARAWIASKADAARALDAGVRAAPSPAAKLHDTLLAYELLRQENDEAAQKHLDAAARMAPGDLRVLAERVGRALSKNETASPALRVPDAEGLEPFKLGLALALKLRGTDRKEAPASPNEAAARARAALEKAELTKAARAVAEIAAVPELERGAKWLASALAAIEPDSRPQAVEWLRSLAAGEDVARRALAARALEMNDVAAVEEAMGDAETLSPAERATLAALVGRGYPRLAHDLDALEAAGNWPLLSATSALLGLGERTSEDAEVRARAVRAHAARGAGEPATRDLVRLARLLAARAGVGDTAAAIDAAAPQAPAECRALALDVSLADQRHAEVCAALGSWSEAEEGRALRALAAGLVAERAGLPERALASYATAMAAEPTCEAAIRAVCALDTSASLPELLTGVSERTEGARAALVALEAHAKAPSAELAGRVAIQGVGLPFGGYLAERAARQAGDEEGLLRLIRERRAGLNDALELAMDSVREALLVAAAEPALAAERLEEAHRARPADVALRELFERLATEPPADRAAWREQRASGLDGPSKAAVLTEAAHEFERSGDAEGALRTAKAAAASGGGALAQAVLERSEISAGHTERLADELLSAARGAATALARREAYERLADLDAIGRKDAGSALLWHRSILEESPQHLPSLRHVEHALVGERRDEELEPIAAAIAKALAGSGDPECSAHAELAARLRARVVGDWAGTREIVELAAAEPEPTLWALRMANAHARSRQDHAALLASTEAIIARATRPAEVAALCVRAAEAAGALGQHDKEVALLERASNEDPGDLVTWERLAAAYRKAGNAPRTAEAFESVARSSVTPEHQLAAWYEAASAWLDEAKDADRGVAALEAAAAIDLAHRDVFPKLAELYRTRQSMGELASLLERRVGMVTDPEERVGLEVERGKALTELGDLDEARRAFDAALAVHPDHAPALMAVAELAGKAGDWEGAEQSLVQLARLVQDLEQQKAIFTRLGEIYATHLMNLSRAELALREVLKRAPGDVPTLERLVELYKRQNDPARAIETQQELVACAHDSVVKRQRLIELAQIHEQVSHDVRKAEQTLEAVRREFPSDVSVLRALAEFYLRHKQLPAMNILLDRAVADAKRAFGAGRFTPALFETVATAYELRGKKDAARVVHATLAAFTGQPAQLRGAEARACDPRLDDQLAPEVIGPAVRGLFARVGPALDAAIAFDPKRANAQPLGPGEPMSRMVGALGQALGLHNVGVMVAPMGRVCVPVGGAQPMVVVGDALLSSAGDLPRGFLVLRALKLLQAGVSAFARVSTIESVPLVAALLRALVPQWTPQGPSAAAVNEMGRRLQPGMPREVDPAVGMMAIEAVGAIGGQLGAVGPAFLAWANRTALLGVGDPGAALEAIAWTLGQTEPPPGNDRAAWIAKTPEAKDLIGFSVSEPYSDVRAKLNLG